MTANGYCVVLTATPDEATAEKIAQGLLENRLAGCVNVIPNVSSHYFWEGKLQKTPEFLLLIKTRPVLFPNLARFIKENHSYKVPEVIALPIADGEHSYLDWLGAHTQITPTKPAGLADF